MAGPDFYVQLLDARGNKVTAWTDSKGEHLIKTDVRGREIRSISANSDGTGWNVETKYSCGCAVSSGVMTDVQGKDHAVYLEKRDRSKSGVTTLEYLEQALGAGNSPGRVSSPLD
jgi:hypothetical protein